MGLLNTQTKTPRALSSDETKTFGGYMGAKDYGRAVDYGRSLGYQDSEIADYVGANKQWGVDNATATNYLGSRQRAAPQQPQANAAQLDQFKGLLSGGDYAGAAKLGRSLNYNDDQIATYAGALGINGITKDSAAEYLRGGSTQQQPQARPEPQATYRQPVDYGRGYEGIDYSANTSSPATRPAAYINKPAPTLAPVDYAGLIAQATSATPTTKAVDYASILANIRGQAQTPQNRAITRGELSQNQLQDMTAQDSPLMQQAQLKGMLQASGRGMQNSSMAAGAAQAAMVNAAQPFALQDAQAIANMETANQLARNQFQLAGYQKGLDTTSQAFLNDQTAQNQLQNTGFQGGLQTAGGAYIQNLGDQNRATLAGYQKDLDTSSAEYLQNLDYYNRGELSNKLSQQDILKQSLASRDASNLAAQTQGYAVGNKDLDQQNRVINAAIDQGYNKETMNLTQGFTVINKGLDYENSLGLNADTFRYGELAKESQAIITKAQNYEDRYNQYLADQKIQDSVNNFNTWKTKQDRQSQIDLANINNGAQLKQTIQQGTNQLSAQKESNKGSYSIAQLDKETQKQIAQINIDAQIDRDKVTNAQQDKNNTVAVNRDYQGAMTTATSNISSIIDVIGRDTNIKDADTRTSAILRAIAPSVANYNIAATKLGLPVKTVYDFASMRDPEAIASGATNTPIGNSLTPVTPVATPTDASHAGYIKGPNGTWIKAPYAK
jgi:hypothetical protein